MKGEIRMKKVLLGLIATVCGIIFVYSAWKLYGSYSSYQEAKTTYQKLRRQVVKKDQNRERKINFNRLEKINPDVIGWIYVPGTKIDYPVVQGEDNEEYLHKTFDGKENSSGAIFMDKDGKSDFLADNNLIYGHHMKNGSMFSGLTEYKKQEFYDSHSAALLLTPDKNYEIEIFAGYVASVQDKAWELAFPSDPDFTEWLDKTKERSCFTSGITPAVTDRILTLSTCSYEFNNARFVLLGVLKPEE